MNLSRELRFCLPVGLLLSAGGLVESVRAQDPPGWKLVWSDEFAEPNGSAPNPANWGYDIGGGGWGNNELQNYTDRTENARIENGELVIEVREERFQANRYTSARLLTQNKWDWTYGRFEARVKVPSGQGLWPAFWMLGANFATVGWPQCGEIDIMEYVGRVPNEVFGTIHGPGYAGGENFGGTYDFGSAVADDYHVYVVEWEENLIRWYVDGILYHTATPASVAPDQWVFDHGFFIIMNVAVGGNFGGPVGDDVTFPRKMMVDYVRVYEADDGGEPPEPPMGNVLLNPGFETGTLSGWVGYSPPGGANANGAYVESTSNTYYNGGNFGGDNVLTRSGTFVGKTFGDFSGSENYNGFHQDVAAAPGTVWAANGWGLTHVQDLLAGSNRSWLEVSFRNSSDTTLALYRSRVLDSGNVTPNSWMYLPITDRINPSNGAVIDTVSQLTAPAGTTKARYQAVFRQPGNDAGAMYFDDLDLTPLPLPVNITRAGNEIDLSFPTVAGVSYEVGYKQSLADPEWSVLVTVPGDGTTRTFSTTASPAVRFFQVLVR